MKHYTVFRAVSDFPEIECYKYYICAMGVIAIDNFLSRVYNENVRNDKTLNPRSPTADRTAGEKTKGKIPMLTVKNAKEMLNRIHNELRIGETLRYTEIASEIASHLGYEIFIPTTGSKIIRMESPNGTALVADYSTGSPVWKIGEAPNANTNTPTVRDFGIIGSKLIQLARDAGSAFTEIVSDALNNPETTAANEYVEWTEILDMYGYSVWVNSKRESAEVVNRSGIHVTYYHDGKFKIHNYQE